MIINQRFFYRSARPSFYHFTKASAIVVALIALLCNAAGCGFHLRGSPILYENTTGVSSQSLSTPIRLAYPTEQRAWASRLKTQLSSVGIVIIDTPLEAETRERDTHFPPLDTSDPSDTTPNPNNIEAPSKALVNHFPTITILNSNHSRRIASYTSRAKAAEYTLTEQLSYEITAASGQLIVPKLTLSSDRVYEFNVNNISGKDQEADLISEELQLDISHKLLRHLFKIAPKLNPPKEK